MRQLYFAAALSALAVLALPTPAATIPDVRGQADALLRAAESARQSGMEVPPDLMPTVAQALSVNGNFSSDELDAISGQLSDFQSEIDGWRSSPGRVGTASISGNRLTVGEQVDLTQAWRPGTSLQEGAAIMVASHWLHTYGLQNTRAGGANFVSVSTPGADLRPTTEVREGIHGGLFGPEITPVFEVTSGSIRAGSSVTIRYRNLELPTRSYRAFRLPLYVRFETGGHWYHIPTETIAVGPAELDRMRMILPTVIAAGESFPLKLRLEDQYGNLAAGNFPPFDILVDGRLEEGIPGGSDPVPRVSQQIDVAGSYEVEVRSAGGGLRDARTLKVVARPRYRVDWVELHAHSSAGDSLAAEADIDDHFAGVADVVTTIDADAWLDGIDWANRASSALDGFERSASVKAGGQLLVVSQGTLTISGAPRTRFPDARDLSSLDNVISVALPEQPTDLRQVDAQSLRLVEIKSGEGTHEWFARHVLNRGYRVGFTGSETAHHDQLGPPAHVGRTAVLRRADESLFEALRAGRTWVTSGPRIFMEVRVNGAMPGGSVENDTNRSIEGVIQGTAPIQSVELIRNGEVIETRNFAYAPEASTLQVTFGGEIAPVGRYDIPRNGREWIGFLRLPGATIESVDAPGFRNTVRQAVAVNPSDRERVDFITWTRGHPSSLLLTMGEMPEDLTVEMTLRAGFEDPDFVPLSRPPTEIPGTRFLVSLPELLSGPTTRTYEVGGYDDSVTFELVNPELPKRVEFEFSDVRRYGEGDYYYVRVRQTDDHMAWSSPVFIGGIDAAAAE